VAIILLGEEHPGITLVCLGFGLFVFSFSAGFGAIYFKDIMAKIFTHKFRAKTMAYRQFFTAFGGIISGSLAGMILEIYEPPLSFGYLFIISSFLMGFGYLAFGSVDEPEKEKVSQREKRFSTFLKNSIQMLKDDRDLQIQITTFLFAYSYLISLPFIILDAQERIDLNGTAIGMLITSQMIGAMLSNLVWGRLMSKGYYRLSTNIALLLHVSAVIIAFNAGSVYEYIAIFFIVGAATDGNRIASGNLILIVAPPEKRPVYVALQMNIISLGMFFSIFGGFILHVSSYNVLYTITLLILMFAFFVSLKLKDE
jgi:MFS family permease